MWKLFLDDLREPSYVGETYHTVQVARNMGEAIKLVNELGIPSHVFFDNDLGEELEGYDFAKWLVEQHLDGKHLFPKDFTYSVHSSNPPAVINIKGYLDGFLRMLND